MSAQLVYLGSFDPEQLLREVRLIADHTWHRDDPSPHPKADRKSREGGIRFVVSDAEFDQFDLMVTETVEFLREYMTALVELRRGPGVREAELIFGSAQQMQPEYSRHLPHDLIAAAGEAGLSIILSLFAVSGMGGFPDSEEDE